ncbi:hypothetical protein RB195_000484 [Necator americanus]|uniref:G-protein coupled receptors family 1 profile domain-containing protein n=1 Tax=Necator americanus TaxID=51031 RepID=A0ABR1D9Z8_NECAM
MIDRHVILSVPEAIRFFTDMLACWITERRTDAQSFRRRRLLVVSKLSASLVVIGYKVVFGLQLIAYMPPRDAHCVLLEFLYEGRSVVNVTICPYYCWNKPSFGVHIQFQNTVAPVFVR